MLSNYISGNHNNFIVRELPLINTIFDLTGNEGFICGGFARFCLSKNVNPVIPGDIDIFSENKDIFNRIVERFNNNPKLRLKHSSQIELKYEYVMADGYYKSVYTIQLIKPVEILNMVAVGDVESILDNFDFTIAKCAIVKDANNETICYIHNEFYVDDNNMVLNIKNIHCPISSLKRAIKYIKRGYELPVIDMIKLFKDYESRSPEWKQIMDDGFGNNIHNNNVAYSKFVQMAYLD